MKKGIFTISLDHELHWGVSGTRTVASYRENLDNERAAISGMLELFRKYEIHATWATVGMLFCKDKQELMTWLSRIEEPQYKNQRMSNFLLAKSVGCNEEEDPYHFAPGIIHEILSVPHQAIGSHTFSHYYCIEDGQELRCFESDIRAAIEIGKHYNVNKTSVVFPRNQYRQEHLEVCYKAGIKSYRGAPTHKMYHFRSKETNARRLLRIIDTYFPISGDNTYRLSEHTKDEIYNIPSSRFFRPYDPTLAFLEKWRLGRITREMTHAAKTNRLYHLWWHPHNFGANLEKNLANLEHVLQHYEKLRDKFQFESRNMEEICDTFISIT